MKLLGKKSPKTSSQMVKTLSLPDLKGDLEEYLVDSPSKGLRGAIMGISSRAGDRVNFYTINSGEADNPFEGDYVACVGGQYYIYSEECPEEGFVVAPKEAQFSEREVIVDNITQEKKEKTGISKFLGRITKLFSNKTKEVIKEDVPGQIAEKVPYLKPRINSDNSLTSLPVFDKGPLRDGKTIFPVDEDQSQGLVPQQPLKEGESNYTDYESLVGANKESFDRLNPRNKKAQNSSDLPLEINRNDQMVASLESVKIGREFVYEDSLLKRVQNPQFLFTEEELKTMPAEMFFYVLDEEPRTLYRELNGKVMIWAPSEKSHWKSVSGNITPKREQKPKVESENINKDETKKLSPSQKSTSKLLSSAEVDFDTKRTITKGKKKIGNVFPVNNIETILSGRDLGKGATYYTNEKQTALYVEDGNNNIKVFKPSNQTRKWHKFGRINDLEKVVSEENTKKINPEPVIEVTADKSDIKPVSQLDNTELFKDLEIDPHLEKYITKGGKDIEKVFPIMNIEQADQIEKVTVTFSGREVQYFMNEDRTTLYAQEAGQKNIKIYKSQDENQKWYKFGYIQGNPLSHDEEDSVEVDLETLNMIVLEEDDNPAKLPYYTVQDENGESDTITAITRMSLQAILGNNLSSDMRGYASVEKKGRRLYIQTKDGIREYDFTNNEYKEVTQFNEIIEPLPVFTQEQREQDKTNIFKETQTANRRLIPENFHQYRKFAEAGVFEKQPIRKKGWIMPTLIGGGAIAAAGLVSFLVLDLVKGKKEERVGGVNEDQDTSELVLEGSELPMDFEKDGLPDNFTLEKDSVPKVSEKRKETPLYLQVPNVYIDMLDVFGKEAVLLARHKGYYTFDKKFTRHFDLNFKQGSIVSIARKQPKFAKGLLFYQLVDKSPSGESMYIVGATYDKELSEVKEAFIKNREESEKDFDYTSFEVADRQGFSGKEVQVTCEKPGIYIQTDLNDYSDGNKNLLKSHDAVLLADQKPIKKDGYIWYALKEKNSKGRTQWIQSTNGEHVYLDIIPKAVIIEDEPASILPNIDENGDIVSELGINDENLLPIHQEGKSLIKNEDRSTPSGYIHLETFQKEFLKNLKEQDEYIKKTEFIRNLYRP